MAVDVLEAPTRAVPAGTGPRTPSRQGKPEPVPWRVSLALLAAIAITTGGLHVVLRDRSWWMLVVFIVAAVLGASAATRYFTARRILPPLAGVAALLGLVTLLFAPGSALLGVVPTLGTLDSYGLLFAEAGESIYRQAIPATADWPIIFVLCLGIGAIAVVCDLVAITLRLPALAGVPLLVILAIPALTARNITDPFVFVLSAAAYLLLLVAGRPRRQPGLAVGIGAAAIIGALVMPIVLPGIDATPGNTVPGLSTGVNPVLGLGDDLRRASERDVLDYTTESGDAHYLRLVTLENFTGAEWAPTDLEVDTANTVDGFGPVPGLSAEVPRSPENTVVDVGNLSSRWLPMPYPPREVSGLDNDWFWEPNGFSVSSTNDTARNQRYRVESLLVQPTPEQLLAAGTTVPSELEPYLALPDDLPTVISDAAVGVADTANSNYEKALALQEYFRSDAFEYSEEAPVEGDYDGTGMDVLATFLEVRAGYCVHFASAMAVMARSLDIPARVVVGFLPGTPLLRDGDVSYEVTTHDLHSWPELYFEGIGWVQFEPTPGRGELGDYADVSVDGVPAPEAPDATAPGAAPVPVPSVSAGETPDAGLDDAGTGAPDLDAQGNSPGLALALVLAALLSLLPAIVRTAQRWRLGARIAAGRASAIDGWTETLRTAVDLRLPVATTQTPRAAAGTMGGGESLLRLLDAVENEGYAAAAVTDRRELARDVEGARAAMFAAAEPRMRALALFYPASLWRRIAHPLSGTDAAQLAARHAPARD